MDKLQEYDAWRRQDVKWNRDQMQKLENRDTELDKLRGRYRVRLWNIKAIIPRPD